MTQTQTKSDSAYQVYKRLLGYLRGDVKVLMISFAGFLIFALCDSAFAWWMRELVDNIETQNTSVAWYLAGLVVLIFSIRGVGSVVGAYFSELVARRVVNKLRFDLFSHLLDLPVARYEAISSGSMLSKLIFNIENVASASTNALRIIVRGGFTILGLLTYMVLLHWQLSLIFLVVTPVMVVFVWFINSYFRRISRRIQNAMANVSERASEVLHGYQVIKVFAGEAYERQRFHGVIDGDREQRMRLILTNSLSTTTVQLFFAFALAGLIVLAMSPAVLQSMSAGEFVSFVTAAGFISRPLMQLTQVNGVIQQGIAAAEGVFSVLDLPREQSSGQQKLTHCRGEIEFSDVSFRYDSDSEAILDRINLTFEAGKTYALVGRSGSGKSTLAAMIPRFYDPQSGDITIDGNSIDTLDIANLRQQIAYVNQNITLFTGTIAENIAYGGLEVYSREQIIAAATQAQVMEFVGDLPQGIDTEIGENGVKLSGGQRQRISIARAFLKNSPILILDEATSALDSESEAYVQAAVEKLMLNKTSLIIAHRFSTIEHADLIIVMDHGAIVEQGNHDELLALQGHYYHLWQQQGHMATVKQ